ncbi:hypothetical protein [Actinosynnema sp. NPDC023587]|uniref:hypothetical protein n=1 Tax=Actinosynnema sp. NPDC023587 TaxID=3154695 RepID=UPI0033C1F6B7
MPGASLVRPGPVTIAKRVAHVRAEALRETFDRLAHEFTDDRCAALDGLLVVDPKLKMIRLRWLSTGPVEASPAVVGKLEFLRGLGADTLEMSVLPAERHRFLATIGRRLTGQSLLGCLQERLRASVRGLVSAEGWAGGCDVVAQKPRAVWVRT